MSPPQNKGYRHLPAFILLAAAQAPGHGADILARIRSLLPEASLDSGAVYRTLNALEREGELTATWDTTGPGPARKVYRLTPSGWERLDFWRADIAHRLILLGRFLETASDVQAVRPAPETDAGTSGEPTRK